MKKILSIMLVLLLVVTSTLFGVNSASANTYEYAMFPMQYLSISQGVNGSFSHAGTNAIDITGRDGGIDAAYAPFTGVVKRIYNGYAVWLESCNPVIYADGTIDYMTVMVLHDNDTSDLYVGKVISQGEHFFDEGTSGYATGNHIHLECGKGKYTGGGWFENEYGSWEIHNSILPYNALHLSTSTVVLNNYSYPWQTIDYTNNNGASGNHTPSPEPNPVYSTIPEGQYFLRCKANGNYLNISYGEDFNGNSIHTYPYGNWDSQVFEIKATADGYEMRPLCSQNRVVNAYADTVTSGNTVNLYDRTNESSQWWKFQAVGDGYIIRNSQNPNVCLTPDTDYMITYPHTNSDAQIWYLEKACTVKYDANGGTCSTTSQRVRAGELINLNNNVPTKTCASFVAWTTTKDVYTIYDNISNMAFYNDTTVYAYWNYNHSYTNNCDTSCNTCGATRSASHSWSNATCTSPKTCTVCGTTEGSAKGHTSDKGTVTKKATCTATGTKTYKCTVCGTTTKTETIKATGHSYADATCTAPKTCKTCKATSGKALGHKYDSGKVTTKATCTKNGVKTYTCSTCKATKTETITKLGHKYSNACDKTCNTCGAKRTVPAHKYTNSCDTTCNVCSAKRTIKHTYTNSCDKTCNTCGAKRTIKHKYTNSCDTTCNVCKATRTIKHTYKATSTTKATLTKNGKQTLKCSVCKKTTTQTVYKPTSFKLSKTSYTYDGSVKTPTVTVKDSKGNTLKKGTDYTVTYSSGRKNVGTYKVTIKMKGKYSGTKTLTFKINKQNISKCSVKLSSTSYTYDGKTKTPAITVKNAAGKTLKKGTDYTVTYSTGRTKIGTYKVTVTMKNKNYTGKKVLTFKIKPIDVSKCSIKLSSTSYTYNGKVKTPTVTVKNSSGKTLKKGTDYTVTYATGRKNVGTYKVTIKMKGVYSGTKVLTFKINPPATTVSKVTAKYTDVSVSIAKKTTQTTGYQVQYSTSKTFSNAKTKTVSSNGTTSVKLSGLKGEKTYYVRVRTYKTVGSTKYYSAWSNYKSVKTKSEFKVYDISFENAAYSTSEIFVIKRNGKWGAVNSKNETIIPFSYTDCNCATDDGYVLMRKDGEDVLYDSKGKKVYTAKYSYEFNEETELQLLKGERISSYNEGVILTITNENSYWGWDGNYTLTVKNLSGKKIASYDNVYDNTTCIDNRIVISSYDDLHELVIDKTGKVIRKESVSEGAIAAEPFFSNWATSVNGGTYLEYIRGTRYTFITNAKTGKSYSITSTDLNGWEYVQHYGTKAIYYNQEVGYRLVDVTKLSDSMDVHEMDLSSAFVGNKAYDEMTFGSYLGSTTKYVLVSRDGKWGYLSLDGKTEKLYDDATVFRNGVAMVKDGKNMYLIDENFNKISGNLTGYDSVSLMGNNTFIVRKGNKQYFVVYNK